MRLPVGETQQVAEGMAWGADALEVDSSVNGYGGYG